MIHSGEFRVGNRIWNGVITKIEKDHFVFFFGMVDWDSRNLIEGAIQPYRLNKNNILKIEGFLEFALETHELGIKNYQLRFTGKSGTNHLITIRFIDDNVYAWLDENKEVIKYMHEIQNIYFWFTKQEIKITL